MRRSLDGLSEFLDLPEVQILRTVGLVVEDLKCRDVVTMVSDELLPGLNGVTSLLGGFQRVLSR